MTERRKYTLGFNIENVELDKHWRAILGSTDAPDIVVSLNAKLQRLAEEIMTVEDELRDWARQDIAMARSNGHPAPKLADKGQCGECYQCLNGVRYDSENPKTHCVDCTCFLCIPGA